MAENVFFINKVFMQAQIQ